MADKYAHLIAGQPTPAAEPDITKDDEFLERAEAARSMLDRYTRLAQTVRDTSAVAPAKAAKTPPTNRECPACFNQISVKATRCGFCTSTVTPTSS